MKIKMRILLIMSVVLVLVVYLGNCIYSMYNLPFVSFMIIPTETEFYSDYSGDDISYMVYDNRVSCYDGRISNPEDIDPQDYHVLQGKNLIAESDELTMVERFKIWNLTKRLLDENFELSKSSDMSDSSVRNAFSVEITVDDRTSGFIIDIPDYGKNKYRSKGTDSAKIMRLISEIMIICPISEEQCVKQINELNNWVNKFNGEIIRQKPTGFLDW